MREERKGGRQRDRIRKEGKRRERRRLLGFKRRLVVLFIPFLYSLDLARLIVFQSRGVLAEIARARDAAKHAATRRWSQHEHACTVVASKQRFLPTRNDVIKCIVDAFGKNEFPATVRSDLVYPHFVILIDSQHKPVKFIAVSGIVRA